MLKLSLRFLLAAFAALLISRTVLSIWLWGRVDSIDNLIEILIGGFRIDLSLIMSMASLPLLLFPWFGHRKAAVFISVLWFRVCWITLVFMELVTPQFIIEYDARPNRLFFEYLESPKEVAVMLWSGYKPLLLVVVMSIIAAYFVSIYLFSHRPQKRMRLRYRPIVTVLILLFVAASIRGTFQHRPINPALVAFSNDSLLNSLTLNSFYSVAYAVYRTKNESTVARSYGRLSEEEVLKQVRAAAGQTLNPEIVGHPAHHYQGIAEPAHQPPLNLVIIVEESLGAQYLDGGMGGTGLTPELKKLSRDSWWFENIYATGTRSARGLEAIVSGFPPSPARAVLKLPKSQTHFFTLASLLKTEGYQSSFVYGGESHFDNMKGFFLGNGFGQVHDLNNFTDPQFVGSWGASDEDMFNELHQILSTQTEYPKFVVSFSVSNHSPWEYPKGRISVTGKPDTVENTVRYADWALGTFFSKAKQQNYWDNTLFLVVADHDARVWGSSAIPLEHFRIPAMILGSNIEPRRDNRLVSQIDLAPTLLSLLGINAHHPMPGQDLTKRSPNRALMQYGTSYGYLSGQDLMVLRPEGHASQYEVNPEDYTLSPSALDRELQTVALAHALWADFAYNKGWYSEALTDHQVSLDSTVQTSRTLRQF